MQIITYASNEHITHVHFSEIKEHSPNSRSLSPSCIPSILSSSVLILSANFFKCCSISYKIKWLFKLHNPLVNLNAENHGLFYVACSATCDFNMRSIIDISFLSLIYRVFNAYCGMRKIVNYWRQKDGCKQKPTLVLECHKMSWY